MFKGTNVLIAGGAGFVGANLVRQNAGPRSERARDAAP